MELEAGLLATVEMSLRGLRFNVCRVARMRPGEGGVFSSQGGCLVGCGAPPFRGLGPQKTPAHEDGYTEIVKTSARQGPIRRVWIKAESVGAFTSRYILAAFSLPGK